MFFNKKIMFIDSCTYKDRYGKKRTRILLRHGYREEGKVKLKTIANISHCTEEEIEAIKIALKEKKNLPALKELSQSEIENGKFAGSICTLHQIARKLGFIAALGESQEAKQILWLIFARLLEQGSRLSATRIAKHYAVGEVMGLEGFCEDNLYNSLDWLYENKEKIENKLFNKQCKKTGKTPILFLYDVSSSYLEGEYNELAEYGYNRDGKKGKKQIVYGILMDEYGEPVSIEAFPGNTPDTKTFSTQIKKIKEQFGCKKVTLVGDKGMIKSAEIEKIQESEFNYITTISKPQIEKLVNDEVIQLELFQDKICEIEIPEEGIRYVFRRNPLRAKEINENRIDKIQSIQNIIDKANKYLKEHEQAKLETQMKKINNKLMTMKISKFVSIKTKNRTIFLHINEKEKLKVSRFDGCYVMKTNLMIKDASKNIIHDRYKDLSQVEYEFRTQKTGYLEIRAIYLRKKERTIAHLFITMLAYKIERYLRQKWVSQNITVEEGLRALSRISTYIVSIGENKITKLPKADMFLQKLLDTAGVILPSVLPHREANVYTRKKLKKQ